MHHSLPYGVETPCVFQGHVNASEEINRAQKFLDQPQAGNHYSGHSFFPQYAEEPHQSGLSPKHCPSVETGGIYPLESFYSTYSNQNNFGVPVFERQARYPYASEPEVSIYGQPKKAFPEDIGCQDPELGLMDLSYLWGASEG